ncbi:MAG: DNA gyrase subunit A, partial [Sporomusaceae bacterium]|jgi:DNA gyrase subunit A|nr:DNA gyrase subunit A [Sporomusaceae bacterium]
VKKCNLNEFDTARKGGINAIALDDDVDLIGVKMTGGDHHIIMGTKDGKAIVYPETKVRSMGRTARGVRGISLDAGDLVVGMDTATLEGEVLTITSTGYGKRTKLGEYRVTDRGGKGIINIKLKAAEKTGHVVGLKIVRPDQELILITSDGIVIRTDIDAISGTGRNTQGVKVMKTGENDQVVALAAVQKKTEE